MSVSRSRARLQELARQAAGPEGLSSRAVQRAYAVSAEGAGCTINRAWRLGLLVTDMDYPWPWRAKRWFATQAQLERWMRDHPAPAAAGMVDPWRDPRSGAVRHAPVQLRGSYGLRIDPQAEAVIPPGVMVQVCPGWTHDPRFQVGPGEVVPRTFALQYEQGHKAGCSRRRAAAT